MFDSAMIDGNVMTIVLVIALFLLWKLDFIATLLNLKAFPTRVPKELESLLDDDKLDETTAQLLPNMNVS